MLVPLQIREMLYQLVGLLGPRMEAFPACGDASSLWVPTLAGQIPHAQRQHLRLLIRHILQPLTRACPRELRYALLTSCNVIGRDLHDWTEAPHGAGAQPGMPELRGARHLCLHLGHRCSILCLPACLRELRSPTLSCSPACMAQAAAVCLLSLPPMSLQTPPLGVLQTTLRLPNKAWHWVSQAACAGRSGCTPFWRP